VEGLLHHVPYLALGHGAEHHQWLRGHHIGALLLLNSQVTHLRPVPMGYSYLVASAGDLSDLLGRYQDVAHLLLEGAFLVGLLDGVAAEGDHDPLAHLGSPVEDLKDCGES
jgi:hypothetical protein